MSDEIIFCESPEEVADAAAGIIFDKQTEAVAERGVFRVALSGGNTPKALFHQLASEEWRDEMSWDKWEVYWGDERAVPPDDPNSNYRLAHSAFLSKVPVARVFPMFPPDDSPFPHVVGKGPGIEVSDLTQSALVYEQLLKRQFASDLPQFDLILLGVGTDGHTASLFPHTPVLESQSLVEPLPASMVHHLPSLSRLTLTYRVLNAARAVMFLITGEEKAEVVKQILEIGNRDLPATLVNPPSGECLWVLDDAAAHRLE